MNWVGNDATMKHGSSNCHDKLKEMNRVDLKFVVNRTVPFLVYSE